MNSRIALIFLLVLVLSLPARWAQAYPSNSVSNKVDFTSDVIYQIVTDRFFDGNPANNPTGAAFSPGCTQLKLFCGGDWQGITAKINSNYLTDMGISAIWISSPVENITAVLQYDEDGVIVDSTAYHGYWFRDMKKHQPAFGTMAQFTAMVNAAHAKNIKVVIDFVPNHTSPANVADPAFGENGALFDNGTLVATYANDPGGVFMHTGGTIDYNNIEDATYRNLFDLVDLNQHNSVVDAYLKAAVKLWLDTGIDGMRVDAVKHMPFGWQKSWMESNYSHKPVFTFGEWMLGESKPAPENHHFANESGMSLLDFRFARRVNEVFRKRNLNMYDLNAMIEATATDYHEVNDQVTFIDNHDMDRFTQVGVPKRHTEQALAFTLTSRGIPTIYYGTEQYMTGDGDPKNRAMMTGFATDTPAYTLIKKLAALRKSNPALAFGTQKEKWLNDDVYIYQRQFHNNYVLVAINRSPTVSHNISGVINSLPGAGCYPGASKTVYNDVLGGQFGGTTIQSGCNGTIAPFTLAPNAIAVWEAKDYDARSTPELGHVGPMMGIAGHEITLSGRNFGSVKGTVLFGGTSVTGANITMWEDTLIKVKVPAIPAGKYNVKVRRTLGTFLYADSEIYDNFEILSGHQVTVRFVVNNAATVTDENFYLVGSVHELGSWMPVNTIGPMYNQVLFQNPTWYYDVSVPANTTLSFKFMKKNFAAPNGGYMAWETGANHTFTTPASGTATVVVNLNGLDPQISPAQ